MLLILLLVGVLAKTACTSSGESFTSSLFGVTGEKVSAVICVDDSASMGYRFQGRSRIRQAADWGRNLLEDGYRFPPGSQVAIVTGSTRADKGFWTQDLESAGRKIDQIHVASHDRPVGVLLKQAYKLLLHARHDRREIYLFNDLTEQSWRDLPAKVPKELNRIYVLDVGQAENLNVALGWPQGPEHVLPAGLMSTLSISLRTGDLPTGALIETTIDGQPISRQPVEDLAPNSEREVTITLPAMIKGTHGLKIDLQSADALDCDNCRYACVSVGDLPAVLLIAGDDDREVANMVTAMIAPPTQPTAEHRFKVRRALAGQLTREQLDNILAVILADISEMSADGWRMLNTYVADGGAVIIIPGPGFSKDVYKEAGVLMPASPQGINELTEPISLAAADLSHPFLKAFEDVSVDSINDRLVYQRLAVSTLGAKTNVVAYFSDRKPALLESRCGEGRVVMLAFSPARQWSQFGTQAAPMIVLLHGILNHLSPVAKEIKSFSTGQVVSHRLEEATDSAFILSSSGEVNFLKVEYGRVRLPTDMVGDYQLKADIHSGLPLLHYSVNVAETESACKRISDTEIKSLFPANLAVVARDDEHLTRFQGQGEKNTPLVVPLTLVLLMFLFAESLFANRFYGFKDKSSG